jgi:hypothetical protein
MAVYAASSDGRFYPRYANGDRPGGQLAAGHWIPAKMALTSARVVLPRPDTETASYAYNRNAHPNVQYVQPVRAQGGAYPHWFELIAAPAGATVGSFWFGADYGVVRWTPTSGTQAFTIRIHDQDGVTVDVTWTVTVGTSWVSFVDSAHGSDSTGTGSFAAPWQTYAKAASTVTGGNAICFRAGTYQPPAAAVTLSSTTHNSMFAYPGETVTMDCSTSTANAGCWSENSPDTWVAGVAFSGGPASVANPRCFANFSNASRMYKWACSFDNPPAGTAGSGAWDNQACWFLGDPGSQRSYIAFFGSAFSRLPPSGNGYMAIDCYNSKYLLFDENTFGAPHPSTGEQFTVFIKGGGNVEISLRKNLFSQGWAPAGAQMGLYFGSDGTGGQSTNQEFCFNTIVNTSLTGWASMAAMVNLAQNNAFAHQAWSYRNTIYGIPAIVYGTANALTFSSESDAIVHDATASGITGKWMGVNFAGAANSFINPTTIPAITYSIAGTECQGGSGAGILDSGFLLTGAFRSSFLGLRGAEIA